MIAGNYRNKIEVYINNPVDDGFGGYTNAELLVGKIFAKINTSSGNKFQSFGIADFKNPITFNVRGYKNQIPFTENHFIRYKGIKYFIKGIENVKLQGLEYNLYCDSE